MWLFVAVSWVCQYFVIVVFPDHSHLLFTVYVLEKLLQHYQDELSNETCMILMSRGMRFPTIDILTSVDSDEPL